MAYATLSNELPYLPMSVQIGIDYTAAMQQSAGIGRYTRELIRALAGHPGNAARFQYQLFVADGKKFQRPELPGQNFAWCPAGLTERWLARLWYRLRLPLWVQYWTGPLDLFHATDFFLPPVKRGTPTLLTVHDLSYIREPDIVMPGMTRHLNTWVPRSVERAEHVIAVSQSTRQDLIELYQTPPEKITVLHHGVTPQFQPIMDRSRLAAIRQKYKLGDRPFVLSLGTLQPRKNYRRLVEAFAHLDPALELVIVGARGWGCEELFEEVRSQNLEERVHFPGYADNSDLPALYSAASLFVYPSLYEGFGLPALEAMACGTPVVASNRSALPEVVGEAGLLVDPQDVEALAAAMSQVLADQSLHQKLSQAGRVQAAKFSWDVMVAKLLKLYQKLLDKEPGNETRF